MVSLLSAALPVAAPADRRRRSRRLTAVFSRPAASATHRLHASCRAATLPPIDDLHEACAPEGALYIDGVLFGGH